MFAPPACGWCMSSSTVTASTASSSPATCSPPSSRAMTPKCAPTSRSCSSATSIRACGTCRARRCTASSRPTRYTGALYDPNAGHIHPLNYTLGLAGAAERQGVRIFEGTHAIDFTGRAPVRVRTAAGEVRCRQLVLCGNVYLGATAPQLQSRIMSVGTCIVATEPLGADRARGLIANNAAVADMNWVLDYFRRSADHRLLFGGRVTYAGFDPDRIAAATRERMILVFPQLKDVRVEFAWGGYVDITRNRAPDFRAPQSGGVLPAGLFRTWHRARRDGRQAGQRSHRRRRRALRCIRAHSARRLSGRPRTAPSGAGAGHAVLPDQGSALA